MHPFYARFLTEKMRYWLGKCVKRWQNFWTVRKNYARGQGMTEKNRILLEKIPPWLALSPYAVALCALLLTVSVVFYSLHNSKRESDSTTQLMLEKGEALLWAVQGALQARRSGQWLGKDLQDLLEQIGSQNNIRYLGLMDNCEVKEQNLMIGSSPKNSSLKSSSPNGDATGLDAEVLQSLKPGPEAQYSVQSGNAESGPLFIVYKSLVLDYTMPGRKHRHGRRGMGMHGGENAPEPPANLALVVAYDLAPLEEAQATDRRHSVIMVCILIFLGLVGLLFLYFVRLYHLSRKRVEEANSLLLRQERLAALGTVAAGVAHEVRNPLSSISGAARIIQEAHPPHSEEHSLAKLIGQEVRRLDKVVGDLLDVSRQDRLHVRSFALRECLDKARTMLHPEMARQGIVFHAEAVPADLCLCADFDRLLQVLLNLFLNALQAMPQGGTLTCTARPARTPARTPARKDKTAHSLVLEVTDNGSGMTPEMQENVFSPYVTDKAQGTGLGLSIVHKIVQAHGGSISVRSTVGVGTSFSLTLPLQQEECL